MEELSQESVKQVICVRCDLKMGIGKAVTQGAHSAMLFFTNRVNMNLQAHSVIELTELQVKWLVSGMKKICLAVNTLEELEQIALLASEKLLEVNIVTDAGCTQFYGKPTITAIAIGPNYSSQIDAVTGHLKLL